MSGLVFSYCSDLISAALFLHRAQKCQRRARIPSSWTTYAGAVCVCVCVCLSESVSPCLCLSVSQCLCLSVSVSLSLFLSLFLSLDLSLSAALSLRVGVGVAVGVGAVAGWRSVGRSVHLSESVSVCVSVSVGVAVSVSVCSHASLPPRRTRLPRSHPEQLVALIPGTDPRKATSPKREMSALYRPLSCCRSRCSTRPLGIFKGLFVLHHRATCTQEFADGFRTSVYRGQQILVDP